MIEDVWLRSTDTEPMLNYLSNMALRKKRKFRLFACACYQSLWPDIMLPRLIIAERYADGLITEAQRMSALDDALRSIFTPDTTCVAEALMADTEGLTAVDVASRASVFVVQIAAEWPTKRVPQADILRDIFGNPSRPVTFSPAWRTSTAIALAQAMYTARDFGNMPILADALEEAGCDNADVLAHCRGAGPHVRGCWVVDLVLNKS